jgi:hypothetical protein
MSSLSDEDAAYLDGSYLNKPIPKNLIDEYDFNEDYKSIEAELRVKYVNEYTNKYKCRCVEGNNDDQSFNIGIFKIKFPLIDDDTIAKKVSKKVNKSVAKELQEIKDSINLFSSRYGSSYINKYENGHYCGTYHEKAIHLLEKIYDVAYITVTNELGNRYITFGPKLDDEIENVKKELQKLETKKRVRDADRQRKTAKRKSKRSCIE